MFDKVVWVFFHKYPTGIGSYRLSGLLPAKYLKIKKAIFLDKDNPLELLNSLHPSVLILTKPFHWNAVNLVKEAKNRGIKIIATFDDWNFCNDDILSKKRNKIMNEVAILSDILVVKTKTAAEVVKNNTGLTPEVISDCLEFETNESIKKISYPFKLAWFGNIANFDTLRFGLLQIEEKNLSANLKIIINYYEHTEYLNAEIKKLNLKNVSIEFIQWSLSFNKDLKDVEIVIIPYILDKKRLVKSINRITESMNLGKFVVASEMPNNLHLKKYCYLGHIGEGLNWIKENENKVLKKICLGNDFAKKNFNIKKISNDWSLLIKKILTEF